MLNYNIPAYAIIENGTRAQQIMIAGYKKHCVQNCVYAIVADKHSDAWGTYGCIEVVGRGEWSRLLNAVKRQGGVDNHILSNRKLVKVDIEKAAAPMATWI